MIKIQEKSFDVYVDDMSAPLDSNLRFADSYLEKIRIGTASGGTGIGYWDGIVIRSGTVSPIQTSVSSEELKRRVFEYLASFEARDSTKTLSYYRFPDVVIKWDGQAGAFAGNYQGYDNVRTLILTLFGNFQQMRITVNKYQPNLEANKAVVFTSVTINGQGKLTGAFRMDIDTTTTWVFANGQWVIAYERWHFTRFSTEIGWERGW